MTPNCKNNAKQTSYSKHENLKYILPIVYIIKLKMSIFVKNKMTSNWENIAKRTFYSKHENIKYIKSLVHCHT